MGTIDKINALDGPGTTVTHTITTVSPVFWETIHSIYRELAKVTSANKQYQKLIENKQGNSQGKSSNTHTLVQ